MSDYQEIKKVILEFYRDLDVAPSGGVADVLKKYVTEDYAWKGMHPFNELKGPGAVADQFWEPLRHAISPIQRRPDIFIAGTNGMHHVKGDWVCCMGHILGLFDNNWLGIPSTRKMVFFRFVEFNEVAEGRIRQTAHFFDIPSVMRQAGYNPFPPETGAWFITPGPRTHEGLNFAVQDPAESRKTMELIDRMIDDLVGSDLESPQDELAQTWMKDMIWYGPTGIGAAYTRARYQDQHQGPFSRGLSEIEFLGHLCRFSEGRFGGFFGWPNLSMKPTGGFMGFPGYKDRVSMRVVDMYRREGDLLAENWIYIDLLHFFAQQGIDILGRMREICNT